MNNFNGKERLFSHDSFAAEIQHWNRAAISLIDIRHNLITKEEALKGYRLPTSAFIYTSGGKAKVSLEDICYQTSRFGLFHGSKGTELTITPQCEWMEYYMVLYKAGEPPFRKKEYARSLERANPFRQQYGFEPSNPIFLSELMRKMFEKWKGPTPLNLFYGKIAFYQLVYEIYDELEKGHISVLQPDIGEMARRYIDHAYAQNISIQNMADIFNVSYSHLHRIFSRQVGKSPQEYLMETRLNACKSWLVQSELSMREIARGTGFSDEYHFNRMFVRHVGVTPGEYRKKMTKDRRDSAIGNMISFSYNEESQVRVGELKEKGETFMFKPFKSKAIVAAALSMMLMLSACSMAPTNTSGTDATPSTSISKEVSDNKVQATVKEETRTISTAMGDVEVPINPQRVVVQYLMGDVLALDVIPLAMTSVNAGAVFEDELKNATDLGRWDFEPEALMAIEPDLIILASEAQYEDMTKIAPTVLVPYGSMTTQERLSFLGEVLNKEDKVASVLAEYEKVIGDSKKKLSDAGLSEVTISAMLVTDSSNSVAGNLHALGAILYNELGLTPPDAVQVDLIDASVYWAAPSMEVLSDYCGEYIIHLGTVHEDISNNAVWKAIPAVSQGKVHEMNTALTYYTDILSYTAMATDVVEYLLNQE